MNEKRFIFLKQIVKFTTSLQNIILYIILLALILTLYFSNVLSANTSNYTWIFSASMQTLAALIALLPISYGYYLSKVEDEKGKDYDSYILKKLEKDVYYEMMFVIFFSLCAILINMFVLFYPYITQYALITTITTLMSIQFVAIFIFRLFDPDRVILILKEFDDTTVIDPNQKIITLDEFITSYLHLETQIKDYLSNENDNELIDEIPLYDIVDKFSKDFPEIEKHYKEFKEIIFHRNNLVHNYIDAVIDYNKYEKVLELTSLFSKLNSQFISDNIFANVSSIKKIIESALKEYLIDFRTSPETTSQISTYEQTLSSLFQSYFVSDYYETIHIDEAIDSDFEIVMNNFSNKKLLGIELKMTNTKSFNLLANAFFKRLKSRYSYLFVINYQPLKSTFELAYMTKDKKVKFDSLTIK